MKQMLNQVFNEDYLKIIRIEDKSVFWIRTEKSGFKWLCTENQRVVKPLKEVRDLEKRFRKYIIGGR